LNKEIEVVEQDPAKPMPDGTMLSDTSRQRLRKDAKANQKKMKSEMKTLNRPLKVGEFVRYSRQQEGMFSFLHEFLKETHPEEYAAFLKKVQDEEAERKQPSEGQINQAEIEEAAETTVKGE